MPDSMAARTQRARRELLSKCASCYIQNNRECASADNSLDCPQEHSDSLSKAMSDLGEQLRDLIITSAGLPPNFDSKANLYLDLGVPSVKAMQLLLDLEDRFGVQIPDEQFVEATSLDALSVMMQTLLKI